MTDEELLLDKNREAEDILLQKYKGLVRKKVKMFYLDGGDEDDLIQEGMIGLFKAIRDFDAEKNASFKTFANLCVERQLLSAIRADSRKKHQPLNTYIPLFHESEENRSLEEKLAGEEASPEDLYMKKVHMEQFLRALEEVLSPMEKEVFALCREDLSYTEIAEQIHKTPKAIDNAIQRIKAKAKGLKGE